MAEIDPIQNFLAAFTQVSGLMNQKRKMKGDEAAQEALQKYRQQQAEKEAASEDRKFGLEEKKYRGGLAEKGLMESPEGSANPYMPLPGYQKPENELANALKGLQIQKTQQDIKQNVRQEKEASMGKDTERQAATFAKRMGEAEGQYGGLQEGGYKPSLIQGSGLFPDVLKDSGQRQAENAKRNFISAVLRKESGAAISPTEFSEANKLYFEQPGDDPSVMAQKQQARADAIEGMKLQAGPAQGLLTNKAGLLKKESAPKVDSEDAQAISWAKSNPKNPKAKKILQLHGM